MFQNGNPQTLESDQWRFKSQLSHQLAVCLWAKCQHLYLQLRIVRPRSPSVCESRRIMREMTGTQVCSQYPCTERCVHTFTLIHTRTPHTLTRVHSYTGSIRVCQMQQPDVSCSCHTELALGALSGKTDIVGTWGPWMRKNGAGAGPAEGEVGGAGGCP